MSQSANADVPLLSRSMLAVIVAQFFSAFGDNALLFATLAVLKNLAYPDWSQPVLQMLFVATYILLAPFVGQMADSFAKGRVMLFANSLKLLGALLICFGFNPFLGYTLVGVGAAAYSPAKYGILTEITRGPRLVKANGLMESSTIAAILLGSVAGGILADWHLLAALIVCALTYAHAHHAECDGGDWHRGGCRRGGQAGDAGNGAALHARGGSDWGDGGGVLAAAQPAECLSAADADRRAGGLLCGAAERPVAGARKRHRRFR